MIREKANMAYKILLLYASMMYNCMPATDCCALR
jgi:hypothetical protein